MPRLIQCVVCDAKFWLIRNGLTEFCPCCKETYRDSRKEDYNGVDDSDAGREEKWNRSQTFDTYA